MKKYVLFACFIVSISLFGQNEEKTDEEIHREIATAAINGWDVDSLIKAKNYPISEPEKSAWCFAQDVIPEFSKREVKLLLSNVSIVPTYNEINFDESVEKDKTSLIIIIIVLLLFVIFFAFLPLFSQEWSKYVRAKIRKN